jgi:hypothetical protein
MSKVKIDPAVTFKGIPCWLWTGRIKKDGYAQVWNGRSTVNAHRFIYITFIEDIPDCLQGDHLCRRRHCVNPVHIDPVTPQINSLRGEGPQAINAKKTHCINGHEFTPENTYFYGVTNMRACRQCRREGEKRRYVPSQRPLKTHCKRGHELTPDNIDGPRRRCLICKRYMMLRYVHRNNPDYINAVLAAP